MNGNELGVKGVELLAVFGTSMSKGFLDNVVSETIKGRNILGEGRGVYRVLVGKPDGKRPLGRPRRRWEDIRMDLQEVGLGYVDWIGLAQDRDSWRALVSAVRNLRVP